MPVIEIEMARKPTNSISSRRDRSGPTNSCVVQTQKVQPIRPLARGRLLRSAERSTTEGTSRWSGAIISIRSSQVARKTPAQCQSAPGDMIG